MFEGLGIWGTIRAGGIIMYPLLLFSLFTWAVFFERVLAFRRFDRELPAFFLGAQNFIFQNDWDGLRKHCTLHSSLPNATILITALERMNSRDERLRRNWKEAMDRSRLKVNQVVRKNLWILGTIATASPFIGLFGTVLGILQSFHQIAKTGAGGFTVVAAGISEALIATAAGILIAVIASLAYNVFQTWAGKFILLLKQQTEELTEILEGHENSSSSTSGGPLGRKSTV